MPQNFVLSAQGETAPRLQPVLFSSLPCLLLTFTLVNSPACKTGFPHTPPTHTAVPEPPSGPRVHRPAVWSTPEKEKEGSWKPGQGHRGRGCRCPEYVRQWPNRRERALGGHVPLVLRTLPHGKATAGGGSGPASVMWRVQSRDPLCPVRGRHCRGRPVWNPDAGQHCPLERPGPEQQASVHDGVIAIGRFDVRAPGDVDFPTLRLWRLSLTSSVIP